MYCAICKHGRCVFVCYLAIQCKFLLFKQKIYVLVLLLPLLFNVVSVFGFSFDGQSHSNVAPPFGGPSQFGQHVAHLDLRGVIPR